MQQRKQGLYDPAFEHDACGVGFVANVNGRRSHQIVLDGVTILKNLVHRGAVGGDMKTGDGAGMIVQIPHDFFVGRTKKLGFTLPEAGSYGVGMLFMPNDEKARATLVKVIEKAVAEEGGSLLGRRDVPVHPECLGDMARASMPFFQQVFIAIPGLSGTALERKLYIVRRVVEHEAVRRGFSMEEFYIPSLSSKTITYKGMFVAPQFEEFYPDLADSEFQSAIALVHQRYSTNTFPSWPLSQPFRMLAHNGEINTLRGNMNRMRARESTLNSDLFGEEISKLMPIIEASVSDSAVFDNVFELISMSGRPIDHTIMMMVPEAFGPRYHISQDKRAFYEYHAAIMEPWDGPAALAFTDGSSVGATLDRNGLRPVRYVVTKSGKVVVASEVGVLDIAPEDVLKKGRLGPGKMLLVDTGRGRIIYDNECKATVSRRKPYRRWLDANRIELRGLFGTPGPIQVEREGLRRRQRIFGYTYEDRVMIVQPMAMNAQEPVGSMGNDAPLAVLSDRPQLLYNYFKQLFAQVTNPPIDPYRENLVMSLMSFVGREGNLLEETPRHCHQLKLPHPILTDDDMDKLRNVDVDGLKGAVVPMLFPAEDAEGNLESALQELARAVEECVDDGCSIVTLSDREVDERLAPIPALLATSAVHHHLVRVGKRHLTGIIIETGEAREVMHFATLIGYGASAVCPYVALETVAELKEDGRLPAEMKVETAIDNYITAIKKGLLKVMSKMGISTIRSYRGAQVFEAVGLQSSLVDRYFTGTPTRIEGVGLDVLAGEVRNRHGSAIGSRDGGPLDSGGNIHYRRHSEKHLYTPEAITLLQRAVRENDYDLYKQYAEHVDGKSRDLCTLRGLFGFKERPAVPLEEVEPEEEIVKRFVSSAMSFGSISKEAHETMAIAMNRLGAASNSGEGGEDEVRYKPLPNGDSAKSMVKQVASGRFGVTSNYLVNSRELQIKMAQGAKPGEGGQLPGHKVNDIIAKVRYSTPGVMLISPPPHHDIYSIEDLAQLIFDLKNANPEARVSVKLVAEVGVGTIAAGVAKGKAEMVLISGHDGGTGASPVSSIKHAGIPWEIGLAETQQTLVLNRLRNRIRVQVDGKLKTGRDVVIGALLGAEEFGFGTVSLVTLGCIMMRKCHLNTCPVGVATQDPELRKRFAGKPEYLVNFMRFVAREVRERMAALGFRSVDEMVGRVDALEMEEAIVHWKARGLDFSKVLSPVDAPEGATLYCTEPQKHDFSAVLDEELVDQSRAALENGKSVRLFASIRNRNRAVGATLSAEISKRYGSKGLPDDTIHCKFTGSAGQSFGAFLARGVTFELEGDANDYFGKGLSGGKLIVYRPKGSTFRSQNNIITGNVNLFGATGGEAYIGGMAGERFAVRNSGVTAVVEGVGDHGCEYMTGGVVVVLGTTGINFAAGMSGGIAFVLDENQLFDTRCNLEMVDIEPVPAKEDQELLERLVQNHVEATGSEYAARILRDWTEMLPQFVKVMPVDYRRALERIRKEQSKETEVVAMTEEVYG
ncbi:MAG: glutamate synthase large subunit [Chitinivibrionales bacterium]|nr:glutamate synthase large subunit [Chitinivibrionales bacterium]MBD3356085.1 glutamate synthase large subunit [Chitinivibrionales bacterium]